MADVLEARLLVINLLAQPHADLTSQYIHGIWLREGCKRASAAGLKDKVTKYGSARDVVITEVRSLAELANKEPRFAHSLPKVATTAVYLLYDRNTKLPATALAIIQKINYLVPTVALLHVANHSFMDDLQMELMESQSSLKRLFGAHPKFQAISTCDCPPPMGYAKEALLSAQWLLSILCDRHPNTPVDIEDVVFDTDLLGVPWLTTDTDFFTAKYKELLAGTKNSQESLRLFINIS